MEVSVESYGHQKVRTVILATASLLCGAMIYIMFRHTHLLMLNWIDSIGMMGLVNSIRPALWTTPEWVVYSLPDGLWMFSYCLFIGYIWDFDLKKCFLLLTILPIYAVSNEIMQYFHIVSGTFDWMDMFAFLTSFILGVLYISFNNVENKKLSL